MFFENLNHIMKQLMIICLLAMGMQLMAQGSKGQEFTDGWASTKKGDTLRGKICYENTKTGERYDKIFFLDAANQKKRYGPERLTSFGTNGKIFEYVTLEEIDKPFLMERIIKGDINLYRAWFQANGSTPQKMIYEEGLFLRKKDSTEYTEVLEKRFVKDMAAYFKGDEDIIQMMKDNNWGLKDIEKIVAAYNAK